MKKIFLVYGHFDDKSFNAAIRDTFIETAKKNGINFEKFLNKSLKKFVEYQR